MIGHDGGTIGQTSYLRLLLELDTTVRFIVNGAATDIYERVVREVVLGICGIEMPPSPRKGSSHVSGVADVVDTYTGIGQHLEVTTAQAL